MLRHNLDLMRIEKNFFENIFNTVMNVTGKTKDNESIVGWTRAVQMDVSI